MVTQTNPDNYDVPSLPITRPGQIREALLAGAISTDTIRKVIQEGLKATTQVFRNGKVEVVPDRPMRLKYLQFLTETVEGLPVKRQEIITKRLTDDDQDQELKRLIARSPAFRESLRELLVELESDHLLDD